MKLSIQSFLTSCALVASLATPSLSQSRFVKSEDFGQKLGRAKKDHHIEANLFAGFANKLIGYSIAYGYIVDDGLAEINIPITYMVASELPNDANGSAQWDESKPPSNTLISIAVKYRRFKDQIDEGLFYGGGLRLWYIDETYSRVINGNSIEYNETFQVWSPISEVGYTYKVSTDFGINSSLEVGGAFSTFPDPPNDPGRESVWSTTGLYYGINIGGFYAF